MHQPWKRQLRRRLLHLIGGGEIRSLVWIALVSAALWGFIELADEVQEGSTRSIDHSILLFFRNGADLADPIGPMWIEEMARDATALGGILILSLAVLVSAGWLALRRQWRFAGSLLLCVGGGLAMSTVLKAVFGRARPDLVPHGSHVASASFPSGHSLLSTVVWFTLAALLIRTQPQRRIRALMIAVAIGVVSLVGVSRIYLGVHWPTDVLAGWTLGGIWACTCWLFLVRPRGSQEPTDGTRPPPDDSTARRIEADHHHSLRE